MTTENKHTNANILLHQSVRLRQRTLDRIKKRSRGYGQTMDEVMTDILDKLETYEKLGYETPCSEISF